MKKFVCSAAFLVGMSAAAMAADLPARTVVPPAPVFALYNWSGFYVGVHAGANFVSSNTAIDVDGYNVLGERIGLGSETNFIGGVQIGYNFQINQFVLGVEADLSWIGYEASGNTALAAVGFDTNYRAQADWLGTVRGRVGVAFDRLLVYGTGGVAFSDLNYRTLDACVLAPCGGGLLSGSADADVGWTVGGGIEYAFLNNLTLKAEYLYVNFPGETVRARDAGGVVWRSRYGDTEMHIVRAGLNFKF